MLTHWLTVFHGESEMSIYWLTVFHGESEILIYWLTVFQGKGKRRPNCLSVCLRVLAYWLTRKTDCLPPLTPVSSHLHNSSYSKQRKSLQHGPPIPEGVTSFDGRESPTNEPPQRIILIKFAYESIHYFMFRNGEQKCTSIRLTDKKRMLLLKVMN